MRDDGLNAAAEEAEEIVDQSALRRALGDGRFEDVRVADFLHALDSSTSSKSASGSRAGGLKSRDSAGAATTASPRKAVRCRRPSGRNGGSSSSCLVS